MLVTALTALGLAPSYFVGAVVGSTGSNSAWTDGDYLVVEADEYDRSFLTLSPDVAIITNIEFDHPDIYTQESYDDAFRKFVERIKPQGVLVAHEDDPGVQRLLAGMRGNHPPVHVVTFGEGSVDWKVLYINGRWHAERLDGLSLPISPGVPGRHNVLNAVAAVIAISELNLETEENPFAAVDAALAIRSFTGVGRRFDLAGEAAGVTVIDDYAHHPTEIAATLHAARERFPDRRIWAIFQPHTYSRTKALIDEFAAALAVADEIVLLDIYAARETDDGSVSSQDLAERIGARALAVPGVSDVVPAVYPLLQDGDVVLTIGAGDITHAAPALVRALERGSID
jgi:UDP-N-acetylmuramate--alanine ligase